MTDYSRTHWVSAAEADPPMGADLREISSAVQRLIEFQAEEAALSDERDARAHRVAVRALVASVTAAVASAAGVVIALV